MPGRGAPSRAAVAAMLGGAPLPPVPARGNGGSGEILALGHLFGGLAERMELSPGAMALINGSPARPRSWPTPRSPGARGWRSPSAVLALSAEAIGAPLEASRRARARCGATSTRRRALRSLRALLAGGAAERQAHQAPVSYRILPRVLGRLREAQAEAERGRGGIAAPRHRQPGLPAARAERPLGRDRVERRLPQRARAAALDGLAHRVGRRGQLAQRQIDKLLQHPENARRCWRGTSGRSSRCT